MEKKYLTIKNIYYRLVAESPTYFKKITHICLALATAGSTLIALKEVEGTAKYITFVPDKLAGYLILAGTVGAFISKMTVSNPDENPKVN